MSLEATLWAWKAPVNTAAQRLVLLSLADRAGENHTCFPSAQRLVNDTLLNRKTVLKAVSDIIALGLVADTGKRVGNGVRVLQLIGVTSREGHVNWSDPKNGTGGKNGTSPKSGTGTSPENGMPTDPKIGIQNLSMNLSMNLSVAHEWIPELEQLCVILSTKGRGSKALKAIIELPSFEFELGAFNAHFSGRVMSGNKKLYAFADWIDDKYVRYVKQNPEYGTQTPTQPEQQDQPAAPVFKGVAKKFKGMSND